MIDRGQFLFTSPQQFILVHGISGTNLTVYEHCTGWRKKEESLIYVCLMCCSFRLEKEASLGGLFGLLKKLGWSAIFTDGAVTSSFSLVSFFP
jgi:hypothetical protein